MRRRGRGPTSMSTTISGDSRRRPKPSERKKEDRTERNSGSAPKTHNIDNRTRDRTRNQRCRGETRQKLKTKAKGQGKVEREENRNELEGGEADLGDWEGKRTSNLPVMEAMAVGEEGRVTNGARNMETALAGPQEESVGGGGLVERRGPNGDARVWGVKSNICGGMKNCGQARAWLTQHLKLQEKKTRGGQPN